MATSYVIPHIKALARHPQRDEAQALLLRLSNQILPILTQRQFRVKQLLEFFPKNPQLLGMNVNRGFKIYIRLRPANAPSSFYPYEALLETFLHELTHMVHGPHNQAFYRYFDQLKEEMEEIMSKGLTGIEGVKFAYAGKGHVIESSRTIAVRYKNDNKAAFLAAQRRSKYNSIMSGDGILSKRLGGQEEGLHLTPKQLRKKALEAAERRRQDSHKCAISSSLMIDITALGLLEEDEKEQEEEEEEEAKKEVAIEFTIGSRQKWTCPTCTLENMSNSDTCIVCGHFPSTPYEDVVIDLSHHDHDEQQQETSHLTILEVIEEKVIDLT